MNGRGLSLALVILAVAAHPGAAETAVTKAKELPAVHPTAPPVALRTAHQPGARLQVRSADGDGQVKALLDLAKAENATALAARSARHMASSATPVARGVGSNAVGSARPPLAPNTNPGIHTVNGRTQGYVVSPGVYLTIKGLGFDDVTGNGKANVIGEMPGGAAPLRIIDWRDDEIDTLLPPGLSGALDQTVFVQVITNAGKTYKLAGGRFIAEREEKVWTTNIDRFVRFHSGTPKATMDSAGRVERFEEGYGDTVRCWMSGTDGLEILDLGRGFAVLSLGADCSRSDTGNTAADGGNGGRTFDMGYGFDRWEKKPTRVSFSFGAWHNHKDKYGQYLGMDQCLSSYQLSVTVSGPKGVPLF